MPANSLSTGITNMEVNMTEDGVTKTIFIDLSGFGCVGGTFRLRDAALVHALVDLMKDYNKRVKGAGPSPKNSA